MSRSVDERKFIRRLWDNGYHLEHQNGSHKKFVNESGHHIVITAGGLNAMVVRRLVKENGLV